MRELQLAKQIALAIEHVKVSRRERRLPYSDAEVAKALNASGSALPGWEEIRAHRLNEFRYARDRGKLAEHALILRAIDALLRSEDAYISFAEMERRHGHKLPPLLLQSVSKVFQGEELGDVAGDFAERGNSFTCHRSIGRRDVDQNIADLYPFHYQSDEFLTAEFFGIVSGHSRWQGEAFCKSVAPVPHAH